MFKNIFILVAVSILAIGCSKKAGKLTTSPAVEVDFESNSQPKEGVENDSIAEDPVSGFVGDPIDPPVNPPAFMNGQYAFVDNGILRTFLAFSDDQYCEHDFAEKYSRFTYTDLSQAEFDQFIDSRTFTIGPNCDGHYSATDAAGNPETFILVTGKVCENSDSTLNPSRDYIAINAVERAFLLSNHINFTGLPCN